MLVRAMRLGWDHSMDIGELEWFDPFERDADVHVFGEYETVEVDSPNVPKYTQHLVNGQVVDPKTIKEIESNG